MIECFLKVKQRCPMQNLGSQGLGILTGRFVGNHAATARLLPQHRYRSGQAKFPKRPNRHSYRIPGTRHHHELSLTARSTTGSIVSGTLGAIGAIFAGYIGRTFIRTQEATADHLRSYFNQPLEFSRFLAAERLLDTIEGDARESAVKDVVKAIVKMPDA